MDEAEHLPLTEAVYYILLSLHKPMHGYAIMQYVKELSDDRVNLGPGTMYGAIKSLLEKKWIQLIDSEKGSRKKEYELTRLGREIVRIEIKRLEELLYHGKTIMRGDYNEPKKD